jgi:cytochrome c-type biogenesis protein CcmH
MNASDISFWGLGAVACAGAGWWVMRAFARSGGAVGARGRVLALVGATLAVVLGLYLTIGRPDLPAQPHRERLAALKERAKSADFFALAPGEQLALMADRARSFPEDPRPWLVTGLIEAALGEDERAARAFEAALRRDPTNSTAMVELGRVLTRLQQGAPSADSLRLFETAAALDAENPVPWLYLALAASQESRWADALRLWPEVQKRLAADDPRQSMAAQMLSEARKSAAGG